MSLSTKLGRLLQRIVAVGVQVHPDETQRDPTRPNATQGDGTQLDPTWLQAAVAGARAGYPPAHGWRPLHLTTDGRVMLGGPFGAQPYTLAEAAMQCPEWEWVTIEGPKGQKVVLVR